MSINIKRTLIRPKGREEYESNTSSQVVTLATQEVVQQATQAIVQSGTGSGNGSSSGSASGSGSGRVSGRDSGSNNLPYYAGKNIVVRDREISAPLSVQSPTVQNVKVMTLSDYNALTSYTSDTLYFCYEPEYMELRASAIQTTKVDANGATLNSSNLSDYFTLTATEVFNDGSTQDVSSAATFTIDSMTIGANTTGVERAIPITGGVTATWSGHTTNFALSVTQYA